MGMRTTIEIPDDLLVRAKGRAAASGISLRTFFTEAVERKLEERKLEPEKKKVRRPPLSFKRFWSIAAKRRCPYSTLWRNSVWRARPS